MNSHNRLIALILAFLTSTSLSAQEFKGKIVGVTDGDSITILRDRTQIKSRLNGIDAPESGQAFGERAKQYVSALCFSDEVTVKPFGKDKYGRLLVDIVLFDGRILNQELVKAGMAWHYKEHSKDELLAKYEREARNRKIGLWSDPHVVAPWDWRHGNAAVTESSAVPFLAVSSPSTSAPRDSRTVYITASGKKYHRDGCRFLSKSKIAISIEEAVAKGYGPCSVCKPSESNDTSTDTQPTPIAKPKPISGTSRGNGEQIVYVTRTGSKYHRAGCRSLAKSSIPMKLKEAATRYGPCSICKPPQLKENP